VSQNSYLGFALATIVVVGLVLIILTALQVVH
jgi:hypothetical protein